MNRIEIADVLRGAAVVGITLIHFIERFSLGSFPEETRPLLIFTDRVIWDGIFFAISGKAYALFALLFGFSFWAQDSSAARRGVDFRGRFMWRLLLLGGFAVVNSTIFPGEILVLYALVGWVLAAVCRLKSRTVAWIAAVLLVQPVEWVLLSRALADGAFTFDAAFDAPFWETVGRAQREGDFWELSRVTVWTGNVANMGWMLLHGRVTQTAGLFMVGMLAGRAGVFLRSEANNRLWTRVLIGSAAAFFPLWGLGGVLPDFITREAVLFPAGLILGSLANLAFAAMIVSAIVLLYHTTRMEGALSRLAPYGRMSLTNYLTQSILGAALFYNWGLGLYRATGITECVAIGLVVVVLQMWFCRWWLSTHRQGPLEWIWKRLTWI